MRVKVISTHSHAATLIPAVELDTSAGRSAQLERALGLAGAREGWLMLCPRAFTVTWKGGDRPEDVEIVIEGAGDGEPAFVQSVHGQGRITFMPGLQLQLDRGRLWLRGPVASTRDGIAAGESFIEGSPLPVAVTLDWQLTRPNQTLRFAAGEPFAQLLVSARANLELEIVTVEIDADADTHEQQLAALAAGTSLRDTFARLRESTAPATVTAPEPAAVVAAPAAELAPTERQPTEAGPTPESWAKRLTAAPPVSCICPTYGRTALLEEAIESFLRQDYPGRKELIVLNDYADQTLEFDHPEVKIVNRSERFASLADKFNAAVALASHDLIFVWHDDDISLPHRLSFSVAQCEGGAEFFKSSKAWFWNHGRLSGPQKNLFHGGSCWRRSLFDAVKGYPSGALQFDLEFEKACKSRQPGLARQLDLVAAELYYIYRWGGTGSYHYSQQSAGGPTRQTIVDYVGQQAHQGTIPKGHVTLRPQWKSDYVALAREQLRALPATEQRARRRSRPSETVPYPPPYFEISPPPPLAPEIEADLFRGDHPLRISVVVPASNESVLLERTVRQFAATLPPDSEVIVVDNGSTDGSADFLHGRPYDNVHLIQTPDALGVAGARNRGLEMARGEIVVFSDAHIDVPERWWQPLAAALRKPEVGVIGPGIGIMGLPREPAACGQRLLDSKLRLRWLPWKGIESYPVPTLGGGLMAMRHETLRSAGAFDPGMPQWGSEDLEICLRYWLFGYEVWVAPSVTVLHYFRNSNPYKVEGSVVTHNLVRVALLHFGPERLARVFESMKTNTKFAGAFVHAVNSDVWQRRLEFAARRVHDDEWFFNKFADTCEV
jgi:glycosyltransferase involved in cell wall biosynthesis